MISMDVTRAIEKALECVGSREALASLLSLGVEDVERLLHGQKRLGVLNAMECEDYFGIDSGVWHSDYPAVVQALREEKEACCVRPCKVVDIFLDDISDQPDFSEEDSSYTLVRSLMVEIGLERPVLLDAYQRIIYGHKRVAAARALGWLTIPAYCLPTRHLWETRMEQIFLWGSLNPYELYKLALYLDQKYDHVPFAEDFGGILSLLSPDRYKSYHLSELPEDWRVYPGPKMAFIRYMCRLEESRALGEWSFIRSRAIFPVKWLAESELVSRQDAFLLAHLPKKKQEEVIRFQDLERVKRSVKRSISAIEPEPLSCFQDLSDLSALESSMSILHHKWVV